MSPKKEQAVFQQGMRLLAKRSMSIHELTQKLLTTYHRERDCDEIVDHTIKRLQQLHILSDYRTAESIAYRHANKGDRFIRQKLKAAGVDAICASQVVAKLGDERVRAKEAALKKRATLKNESRQQKQEQLIRFLFARGFETDICHHVAEQLT